MVKNKTTMITMTGLILLSVYWLVAISLQTIESVWAFFENDNRWDCFENKNVSACKELVVDNKAGKEQMLELIAQIESENIEANKIIEGELAKTLSWTDFTLSLQ